MIKKVNCKLIIIGGSSGGVEAVLKIVSALKNDFQIPIVIVLHQARNNKSSLAEVLQSRTKLKVTEPEDKEMICNKHIYVAAPDYHLLVEQTKTFGYSYSDPVNYSRPSIDVFFESVADVYHEHVVAILLSGSNSDGAQGMKMIKDMGGLCIVQDPATAESPKMPQSAIDITTIDYIIPLEEISNMLNQINNANS